MLTQLIRPAAYLRIKHPSNSPFVINWVFPGLLSGILVLTCALLIPTAQLFGDTGAVARTLGFIQSLPGFYIAALAAVATFNSPDMLKLMPGVTPTISVLYNGAPTQVPLTRRRFLSSMFAYLTALSVVLTLVAIGALCVSSQVGSALPPASHGALKAAFAFMFFGFVFQLTTVTLWGIFYLGERIHTPDP